MTDEGPQSGSQMSAAEHWRAWLERYGDDYGLFTDEGVEVVGASLPG